MAKAKAKKQVKRKAPRKKRRPRAEMLAEAREVLGEDTAEQVGKLSEDGCEAMIVLCKYQISRLRNTGRQEKLLAQLEKAQARVELLKTELQF